MKISLKKKQKKQIISIVIIIIILLIGLITGATNKEEIWKIITGKTDTSNSQKGCKVISVVDGDTFKIMYEGKEEKVRLIGIDTPESVHPDKSKNTEYGIQVSNYVKELIEEKEVKLEFDVSQRDKYGRLLAYVYLENNEMLNEKLLKEGYAKISTYPPNVKYVEQFTKIQEESRRNEVGLWKENIF